MPRTAKVFMTNRSQAVRLPKKYQFSTSLSFTRAAASNRIDQREQFVKRRILRRRRYRLVQRFEGAAANLPFGGWPHG